LETKKNKVQDYERLGTITRSVLLIFVFLFVLFPETEINRQLLAALLIVGALYIPTYHFIFVRKILPTKYSETKQIFYFSHPIDIIAVTMVVLFSGAHLSPLFFLYYIVIASIALPYGKRAGFFGATATSLAFSIVYGLEFLSGSLAHLHWQHTLHFLIEIGSFWVVAFLSGNIGQILERSLKEQAALALRNEQLFRLQKKEAQRIAVINSVSKMASSTLDMLKVCTKLVRELKKIVDFDRVSISLLDEKGSNVESYALSSTGEVIEKKVVIPKEVCCAEWVTRYKKPLMRPDLAKGIHFETDDTIMAQGIKTCFSLPLVVRDKVIGTFCLYNKKRGAFNDDDVKILVPLTEQLSIAIENAKLYGKVKQQAVTDHLTGLYNHSYFQHFLSNELARAKRYQRPLSVVMLDLDGFKGYNDNFGHPEGDRILKKVGEILQKNVRDSDIAARYGGDEFILVLPETTIQKASTVAERIQDQFKEEIPDEPHSKLGISVGVASFPTIATSKSELIKIADDFLYGTKKVKKRKIVGTIIS